MLPRRPRLWPSLLVPALICAALLLIPLSPGAQGSYAFSRFISRYGDSWCLAAFPLTAALSGMLLPSKEEAAPGLRRLLLTAATLWAIASMALFLALIMPRYTYLELPPEYGGPAQYYFGQTMGDRPHGRGRTFSQSGELIHSGEFADGLYIPPEQGNVMTPDPTHDPNSGPGHNLVIDSTPDPQGNRITAGP